MFERRELSLIQPAGELAQVGLSAGGRGKPLLEVEKERGLPRPLLGRPLRQGHSPVIDRLAEFVTLDIGLNGGRRLRRASPVAAGSPMRQRRQDEGHCKTCGTHCELIG